MTQVPDRLTDGPQCQWCQIALGLGHHTCAVCALAWEIQTTCVEMALGVKEEGEYRQ
jgi:hypothetical protein